MQKEQWNEALNNDILLTKIENLERKLTVIVSNWVFVFELEFLVSQFIGLDGRFSSPFGWEIRFGDDVEDDSEEISSREARDSKQIWQFEKMFEPIWRRQRETKSKTIKGRWNHHNIEIRL